MTRTPRWREPARLPVSSATRRVSSRGSHIGKPDAARTERVRLNGSGGAAAMVSASQVRPVPGAPVISSVDPVEPPSRSARTVTGAGLPDM